MNDSERVIVWRRIDGRGMELATISSPTTTGRTMKGTAVVVSGGARFLIRYGIDLDDAWRTRHVRICGTREVDSFEMELVCDGGTWRLDEESLPTLDGCIDIDLGFSPLTNTLPIRRCKPAVGESFEATAAWLRFPEMTLEPLEQSYERTAERRYLYRSSTGFEAMLEVDEQGLVSNYPGGWEAIEVGNDAT